MGEIDPEARDFAYIQLARILRGQIEDGTIPPGRALPSESQLAGRYGVSRLTARKSVRVLVADGLAETIPGRGTYVLARS